jgi:hypothetical protein
MIHIRSLSLLFIIAIVVNCTSPSEKNSGADSLSASSQRTPENTTLVEADVVTEEPVFFGSVPFNNSVERESYLALEKLQGKIFEGYTVNLNLLSVNSKNPDATLVVMITSSDSTYEYETNWSFRSHLVVFEQWDDSLRLIDQIELPSTSQYHLTSSGVTVGSYEIHDAGSAVSVTSFGKEEGAGDSGYNKEHLDLYILLEDKLTKILAIDTRDDSFSSCECEDEDGYYESNKSATVTILDTIFKHFFDIAVEERISSTKETEETNTTTYRWQGNAYAALEQESEEQ